MLFMASNYLRALPIGGTERDGVVGVDADR